MTHIVKRKGHKEKFDERKVYASIYASCLSSHILHEEAELIADRVTDDIKVWISNKEEVSSKEIFERAQRELKHLNKNAAFMYSTHKDLS